jgi:hypothetical protein
MKKRNIKSDNERVEKGFPKNPDNISKDELHEHFDLDKDGKVTLDEYSDHIDYHCENPDLLEEKLEEQDYERGFKYNKGGETGWPTYRISVYEQTNSGGYQFAQSTSNNFLEAVKYATDKMKSQRIHRSNTKPMWVSIDEFQAVEDRDNELYPYQSIVHFSEKEMKSVYEDGGDVEQAGKGGYDEAIMNSKIDKTANAVVDRIPVAAPFKALGEAGSSMIIGDSEGESRKKKQVVASAIFAPHKLVAMRKARAEQNKSLSEEFKRGGLTKDKAKLMLEDGIANGKPLTSKQKKYFTAIANGAKYSKGGYTKEGVKLRTALAQMKNVKDANGLFVYNPYYEKWGWINDSQLEQGILPHRVAVHYKKNDEKGKGSLENVNDLIVVREGYYSQGGFCCDKEYEKREKSRNSRKMKKGGSVLDNLKKKWNLQDEIMYLEDELRDVESELNNLFTDMEAEAGEKGEAWTDKDGNRYGVLMNKAESRKESIKKLIKDKTEKWDKLEQS